MHRDALRVSWGTAPSEARKIHVPASKSELNRMLICAALSNGKTRLQGKSNCDDVVKMISALKMQGADIQEQGDAYVVSGGGLLNETRNMAVSCGSGGTTFRFLMALAAARRGRTLLKVDAQLRNRPIKSWLGTLGQVGSRIQETDEGFCVEGSERWPQKIEVDVSETSQFASALMMVTSFFLEPTELLFKGEVVSSPYLQLTRECVEAFGANIEPLDQGVRIHPVSSKGVENIFELEADASSAAVWLAAKKLGWPVLVENYPRSKRQADACFPKLLEEFNEPSRQFSLKNAPDLAPVLAALSALLPGNTTIFEAQHLRHKESNRIEDLQKAYTSLGIELKNTEDGLSILGDQVPSSGEFSPFGDHRLAMAATLFASQCDFVTVLEPFVVQKSYPEFWEHAQYVGWSVE